MATSEPMRTRGVCAPWQTERAPPWSWTRAMWSGERNPSGAECSVVYDTISPTPGTVVGVIRAGWCGQEVAGGATISPQREQREAGMRSIIVSKGWRTDRAVGGVVEVRGGGVTLSD